MTAHRTARATARHTARPKPAQTLAPHGAHGLTGARTRARANCVFASHNKFTCTRTTPCARAARALRGFQACAHPCGGVRYTRAVAGARFHPYA